MTDAQTIIDVSKETFQTDVMDNSNHTLVVVDFWAPWCQPCKTLLPMMHKLAEEYAGGFILAKVDIDNNQELAQAFAVKSVPTVKFVKAGKLVDEFTGVLPEAEIRARLDANIMRESDQAFLNAFDQYQQAADDSALRKQAIENMIQVCNSDTQNNPVRIQLAKILVHETDYEQARIILEALPEPFKSSADVKNLLIQIDLAEKTRDLPPLETLLAAVDKNPDDLAARLQLSSQLTVLGEYESAFEQLFEIIRRDRSFDDDVGRREMLKLFDVLGAAGENEKNLVGNYRRKLARYLN